MEIESLSNLNEKGVRVRPDYVKNKVFSSDICQVVAKM